MSCGLLLRLAVACPYDDDDAQEILVSTPRRFGKTISVSMFAAAMMIACPSMELSIYSTCKRISVKMLRMIVRFMELIYLELGLPPYKVRRQNQEEVHIEGPEGVGDLRVINSYPSKIGLLLPSPLSSRYSSSSSMEDLYKEAIISGEVPPDTEVSELWQQWLWDLDCNGPLSVDMGDMNRCQIVGLLLCIFEYKRRADDSDAAINTILPHTPTVHLYSKPMATLSLHELADQVECLQLNWGHVLSHSEPKDVATVLRALMARLGELAQHAYAADAPELDNVEYITSIPHLGGELVILTRKFLRQMVTTFMALFRVLHCVSKAQVVPGEGTESVASVLKMHHAEASLDFFYNLQQVMHLAPGMRLVYKNDFDGQYNDISQVVYFHYDKYARQAQYETIEEIVTSALHTLPLVCQLFPDIPVIYDDDSSILGFSNHTTCSSSEEGFAWLVTCGTIFLIDDEGSVYGSPDGGLLPLLVYVLNETGRSIDCMRDSAENRPALSAYSHIDLL